MHHGCMHRFGEANDAVARVLGNIICAVLMHNNRRS